MATAAGAFNAASARRWTRERLERLDRQELLNLRDNAQRLGETELTALCDGLLGERPSPGGKSGSAAARKQQHKLVPRSRAFGTRGVYLQDARTSWSGIRKADGVVVMAMWQAAVQAVDGACVCLLWAPNVDGTRPWSDSAAGRERLEHCRAALERGGAEGLLVQGEALDGRLPEDKARTVLGIDTGIVVHFQVEMRGAEYWATWGKAQPHDPL
jgi:hypothetical protein